MKYFIKTYGCQMNNADSEKIVGGLKLKGYQAVDRYKKADLVIINTCSVRQSAEDRVLGLINNLLKEGRQRKKPFEIILTGCMLRYGARELRKMLPGVNKFVKISKLTAEVKPVRGKKRHAWVTVMEGCDNFCTYCVVPYARGREVSRPIEEIYCEVLELVKRSYDEITLLGQNVNSYHKGKKFKVRDPELKAKVEKLRVGYKNNFAVLLALLHTIKGLEKIEFITSNPHDLEEGIIRAMRLPKISRYLHLAVQSGDDKILKKMNRKYTAGQFLNLIRKIRKQVPDIEIGTDIIVGFPGETEQQFLNTVSLCRKVKFKTAYISKYSPRKGTAAFKLEDNVSAQEKKRRWQILNNLINQKQ